MTITPADMKRLETEFMADYQLPGALLMEHAAQGVVDALARRIDRSAAVLFLCGPGNNGGDGYAAARLWQAGGGRSLIWELSDHAAGDALLNRRLALQCRIPIELIALPCPRLPLCDAVVDALFGTGLARDVTGAAAEIIRLVNRSGLPVIAVDIPSGLDGLTGEIRGSEAIRADETVTFHRIKNGLLLHQGPQHAGDVTVQPILIPDDLSAAYDGMYVLEPEDLPRRLPDRPADCHKGDFGRVVILAGSPGMAGAAAFCAEACVHAGAGLTTLLCRESLLPTLQALVPQAMCRALPEHNGLLTACAQEIVLDALRSADAACIGCGLGREADVMPLLRLFRQAPCPVVWDADALNLLAAHDGLLPLQEQDVITPHPGEAARLLDISAAEVTADPLGTLDALHEVCGCTVLLKGARTLISDGLCAYVNRHGSPALAKGGSGDVLSGVIAALLARRAGVNADGTLSSAEAAALGALIHGLAGRRAAGEAGENGLTPQALIRSLRLR